MNSLTHDWFSDLQKHGGAAIVAYPIILSRNPPNDPDYTVYTQGHETSLSLSLSI